MELASNSDYSEVAESNDLNAELKIADLDMNELKDLNALLKIADSVKLPLTSRCCIYKVPPKLRKVNNEAYTPSVVSIGPYHLGNKRLKSMQELKVWYVNRFLKRNRKKSLQDYLKSLKDQENEIRECYSETIQLQDDKFVRMIFTDACFIIEFFLARAKLEMDVVDPLVDKLWPTIDIALDLILLENQLPFFVLTHIFNMAFPGGFKSKLYEDKISFDLLTFGFFMDVFFEQIYPPNNKLEHNSFPKLAFDAFVKVFSLRICSKRETDPHRNDESHPMFMKKFNHNSLGGVKHLCDVLRRFYLPTPDTPKSDPPKTRSHSASQLHRHEAGMEFQADDIESGMTKQEYSKIVLQIPRNVDPAKTCSHSASQLHEAGMKFQDDIESGVTKLKYLKEKKVLMIPRIVVSDWTETMLRNVVALEQCHYLDLDYVTDYVCLLDDLIDTEKDVKILVEQKIMENWLSDSNGVASMVNKLGKNVVVTNTNKDYNDLLKEMDEFCDTRCHKYTAIFMREYWSTPWKITSVIAATVLLVLTFLQTIFSAISL